MAASLRLKALGEPQAAGLLLSYGAYDPAPAPSCDRFDSPDCMLSVAEMDGFWANYTTIPDMLADPLVAPIHGDLSGLPPTSMIIAECDILADSNHLFAERLRDAKVKVDARTYAGATHSFLEAVSVSKLAGEAFGDAAR